MRKLFLCCEYVFARLTLIRRPGSLAASWAISVEPMHPVPPVTRMVAPRSLPARSAFGQAELALFDAEEPPVFPGRVRFRVDQQAGQPAECADLVFVETLLACRYRAASIVQLCQMQALRARSRCMILAHKPARGAAAVSAALGDHRQQPCARDAPQLPAG
jgi:hypothetical protein